MAFRAGTNYTLLEEYEFYQYGLVLKEKILDLSSDKYTLKDFSNRGLNTLTEVSQLLSS